MNLISKSFDFVTRKQAEEVCRLDSGLFSKNTASFIKANAEVWYVLTNTWLLLIDEYSQRTRILAQEYILSNGLVALIKNGDALADDIMHGTINCTRDNHVWLYLLQDIADSVDRERKILTLLRFAKRLSPAKAELVNESSLASFLTVNDQNYKQFREFDCPGQYGRSDKFTFNFDVERRCFLWKEIKDEFNKLVPWNTGNRYRHDGVHRTEFPLIYNLWLSSNGGLRLDDDHPANRIGDMYFHPDNEDGALSEHTWNRYNGYINELIQSLGEFSNGSTFEGAKTLKEKLVHYSAIEANWDGCPMYPTRTYPHKEYANWQMDHVCRVQAVPKSFKSARIIAKEQTRRAYFMQGLRKLWVEYLESTHDCDFVDVEDQSHNQEACRLASIDREMVTVDKSHASDGISVVVGTYLSGPWFDKYVYQPYASHYMLMPDGKYLRSNIYLTSGSPCTFIYESCFFLAVARAATHYVNLWITNGDGRRKKCHEPLTFGDDVLIDYRAYDLYLLLITQLGGCVNESKTFGFDSDYKESCGVEYRNGYPLHTVKWPRNCFRRLTKDFATPEELASIISLQHKVFDLSWKASRFLIQYVRSHEPKMTSSLPYTECDDLWEEIPRCALRTAPGYKIQAAPADRQRVLSQLDQAYVREVHMTLNSSYDPVEKRDTDTEMYRYVKFLKEGPTYASPLDRLLGISMNPSRSAQLVKPAQKWQLTAR